MAELIMDEAFWSERYRNKDTGWDVGEPTPPIISIADKIENPDARILIPGAGNAWEAEYIWHQGFDNIFVLDISQRALDNFSRRNPDFPEEQLIHTNFFDHQGEYDLIIEQTFFCAIHPSQRKQYVEKMYSLLADGGVLTGVLFNDPLNSDRPPFGGNTLEYLGYFSPVFSKLSLKECKNSIPQRSGRELLLRAEK